VVRTERGIAEEVVVVVVTIVEVEVELIGVEGNT
jgi:hypothetical protein